MRPLRLAFALAVSLAASLTASLGAGPSARADVAPPPGRTRVAYHYQLERPVEGRVVVAFATYTNSDSNAQVLEAGKEYSTVQGYRPGLYSLVPADAAALPKKYEEAKQSLETRGAVCLKQVPRVFEVPTAAGFNQVSDVFQITMVEGKCQTRLASTTYRGGDKTARAACSTTAGARCPRPSKATACPR